MIYFSDFGSGAVTVSIAVMDLASGTTTGAHDVNYTSSLISGVTPAATLIVGSIHQVANDPGETATACISVGAVQGSTDVAAFAASSDAQTDTDTIRGMLNDRALQLNDGQGSVPASAAGTNISGGVQLNYTANTAVNKRFMAACFAGADVMAKAGTVGLGTGTSAIDVNTVGFQPDAVILFSSNDVVSANDLIFQFTFGACVYDGGAYTQRSVGMVETENATDGAPFQALQTDCAACTKLTSASITKMVVSDFDANGFSITPNSSQGSDDVHYLALKFTGRAVKIVDFTTPTSTGSQAITGAGFTPQFALAVLTNLEAVNGALATSSDLQSGFAISFIGDEQWSTSIRLDSGAPTTDTGSQCSNNAIMGASATDCDAIKASLTSFDSDGMTLNYSAVQANGKKGFILFVE